MTSTINESLFRQSELDDYPLKRDDKHTNKIIQPEFSPLNSEMEVLPEGFVFSELSLENDEDFQKVSDFLNANYTSSLEEIESTEDAKYFTYSPEYVKWVLAIPGPIRSIVLCVMGKTKVNGIICARPICYRVDNRVIRSYEVGWLCSSVNLRKKRLAAVMMKELYRRIQAAEYARDVGLIFSVTDRQLPCLHIVGPTHFLYKSIDDMAKPNKSINLIRFANRRDISRMMKLYKSYQNKWRMYREYNQLEFEHCFLKRGDVSTYVVRTDKGDVKDFISMSTLNTPNKGPIAHVHFVSFLNDKLLELFVQNILYILSKNGYSGIYIEDINGVGEVLKAKLDFKETHTHWYYQYNYNTKQIPANETQISSLMF